MSSVVWAVESKTGLGFEIGPLQQKSWRRLNFQLKGNPAVINTGTCLSLKYTGLV